jgi:hypothetical protein
MYGICFLQHDHDAAGSQHCRLVQPAVSPCGTEQAALIVSTALQYRQQACIWQL